MTNASTRLRSSVRLAAAALLFAACSGDDVSSPGSLLEPRFNAQQPAGIQLLKLGPAGTTATFQIIATGGTLPLGSTVTLDACDGTVICGTGTLVWQPSGTGTASVTITEIATTGNTTFVALLASVNNDGAVSVINVAAPSAPTVTVNMGQTSIGSVRFKNEPGPPPSLRLAKSAGSPTVNVGSPMTFSMTVSSEGPGTATGVTLSDPLPGGLGIVWSTASAGCAISGSAPAQTLNCSFGDLAAGQSRTAVVSGSTNSETLCSTYPNTATVNATNHAAITASASTSVVNCAIPGRMTGGGGQIVVGGARITRGFTIHCDIVLSNNIEINWGGNKWHIDKPITSAVCIDDPNIHPEPPASPFDTFIGEAMGRYNGADGYKLKFTFIDGGEPSRNADKASLLITAPNGDVVLNVPLSLLDHGNLQAHYDQPHR